MGKTRLSVNINKVALIRNSRGENKPNLIQFAQDCEEYGAEGITVHPRPDERHIRYDDLQPLKDVVKTEFNIEGYPNKKFIDKVCGVKPHQVTLVPDPPGALTSDAGWDPVKHKGFLTEVISEFKKNGIRVSIFLNPDEKDVNSAQEVGTDRVELYTGGYARRYMKDRQQAVSQHVMAAKAAEKVGIGLNAGHDFDLDNLNFYISSLPNLLEVSIGHALVSDAMYYGIQNTISMYKRQLSIKIAAN